MDEAFWQNAQVVAPQVKPTISLRLPREVLEFFKAENPKGYTARMAAVLTAYVNAHQRS
ncbi:MAG: BrnA antitoxin family protein [Thiothrix sp.]|uniref:BrnA antitoxin family protein n=1 Tax=Thiothrix sp. TaxID=1032 RepID=UPI002625E036|nr:BrnA antitoxin family protein [Thiothrix sp.]MDD5392541.1 BrnA antitoxin family protein [Thiothrix sp.]